jgi:hypothetical protein
MPFNKLNITFTAAQLTAINAGIDQILANIPFGVNLTKEERISLPNIADERRAFVEKIIDNYALANPNLVTGFAGTVAEAATDLELFRQFENPIERLLSVVEICKDTQQVAGSEAYTFSREFYSTAQRAAENNVPGSDAIVDDLGQLFEGQGPGAPVLTPPPPPPPTP